MKKTAILAFGIFIALLTASVGCTKSPQSANTEEIKTLKKENAALKAKVAAGREEITTLKSKLESHTPGNQSTETPSPIEETAINTEPTGRPETKTERFSYAVGLQIGGDFEEKEFEIDFAQFAEGIKTAYLSKDPLISEQDAKEILDETWKHYQERQRAKQNAADETAKKEGAKYLSENLKKPGVKSTPSGLQYRVIRPGKGTSPTKNDKVEVHYRGWTIDGTEFDSSHSRNKPSSFGLSQVIRGWTEALLMMKTGSKWEIVVPQDLAYGVRGKRPKIPPYSTLRFEVELLSVINGTPQPAKKPVTSNIVRIPSQAELQQGANPEVLTKEQEAEYKKKNK